MTPASSSQPFEILALSPAALGDPALAVAAARAGAVGVLDLEFCGDAAQARRSFSRLLDSGEISIGLRFHVTQLALLRELQALAGERPLLLIAAGAASAIQALGLWSASAGSRRFVEILDAGSAALFADGYDGLIARGHEAGGWVSEDSSFILLQKLAGKTRLPLYVQGGVGVRSAAACRAAGAHVVIDDALLLLAESPLPLTQQNELARLNGVEARLFGELVGKPLRGYARAASAGLKAAEDESRHADAGEVSVDSWTDRLQKLCGWAADNSQLLPIGQAIGFAAQYRRDYGTVGKLIHAIRRGSLKQIEQAASLRILDEHGPLAKSHGTRFPLAQGPMTRVSDSPEFAVEVARAGALPFLALALSRGAQVAQMLEQTRDQIGDRPWGVGMLGFVPQALREEQCAEIWKCKPSFALIAGGRPDQAAEFESRGIATYIHAPAPALLKLYLEQGARRFVFEGRECGGHVGPLASFALWEQMIDVLLTQTPAGADKEIHLLFAGGIHDARSAAMVAAMAAPLAARGMKVGCLMGTAYLFTHEIVSSGAVVENFQREAINCQRTMNLESGPGHASRCVDTKFAHDFYAERRRLLREGKSSEEIRDALEDLNLGRLRIASKGINRGDDGKMRSVDPAQQLSDGMYMIGQVATLRDAAISIDALHADVSVAAQALLERLSPAREKPKSTPSDIAIVGIGVVLPKANDADEYWRNVLNKVSVIREAPESRWDWKLYFDQNPKQRDKIYSRWGGFLDEIAFDPMRFGIPPKSMKSIDPLQILTLEAASRALADAGYANGGFDRESTSVILGASGGAGDLGAQYALRAELPRYVENLSDEVWDRLPEWTEESFAGTLLNVAAGRVANRMDFGGINYTIDAACASSLAAISVAVNELETGRSSMVLAGGFDTTQSAYAFTAFAKTQALSISGQPRTFDQDADGIAISEGVAMVVLKRLADAERDGDRIYAVIKSAAGSSDGKALGLTAPRSEGQVRALNRAYDKAGFSPATLGLIEAHGTGTPVGDRAEAQTVCRALVDAGAAPKSVAIGSVKTLIGHTKAAAGVSGMIKVALALYRRVLPAHFGVSKPIDAIADPAAPAYLLTEPRAWLAHPEHPRRGAASAFGFGGTNFHVVLEEHRGNRAAVGADRWPQELFVLRAATPAALAQDIDALLPLLGSDSRLPPAELAFALARQAQTRSEQAVTLALVAANLPALAADLKIVAEHLRGNGKPLPPTIRYNAATPQRHDGVAFLFPGQGSQYVNMGREAALYVDELRTALEFADHALRDEYPQPLSSRILPSAAFDEAQEEVQRKALTDTRVAQPAIGALALGYLQLARRLGLQPQASAGHSYGEYSALMAAGVIGTEDFLKLSALRGQAMAHAASVSTPGAMAAVLARREHVTAAIAEFPGVIVANHNAPEQCVLSGPKAGVEQAIAKLSAEGLRTAILPVSGAFHTELVAPAKTALSAAILSTRFAPAQFPVYSNSKAAPYPSKPAAMQALLDEHLLSQVEFVAEIEAMYAAGCSVFVELGPKNVCANLARQTLAGRAAVTVSLDGNGGGLRGLLSGLAELYVAGVAWQPAALFAGRELALLDLAQLAERAKPAVLPQHTWMISGGCSRPLNDPEQKTGVRPALTAATREAARARLAAQQPVNQVSVHPVAGNSAAPSISVAPSTVNAALSSEALIAYQQTMRQFLSLQERVVQQFLGGAASAPMPSLSTPSFVSNELSAARPVLAAVAPASAAPASAIPAVTPRDLSIDAKAQLLTIVAERTGYPSEMLALDADLEADLGIDSIKRVEILGAFRKSLPAAASEAMQARMERFTKAKTLQAILSAYAEIAPASVVSAAADVAVTLPASHLAPNEPAIDIKAQLLAIVAERTGYPSEMLSLDADLEADLGIDSIKRVEILGAFRKAQPVAISEAMQAQMERFTKAKSLQAILSAYAEIAPASAAADVAVTPLTSHLAPNEPAIDIKAQLLGIVAERTGYPSEMLSLDADLEADLGIDSIKRVEILGAFRKAQPAAISEAMQARMERYTKAKSLQAILSAYAEIAPASVVSAAADVAVTPPTSRLAPNESAIDAKALLLSVVAERTGYPSEMLSLDTDLEADLGIDSIKRVEILGAFRKALPAANNEAMQAQMERFTKAKSLQAILSAYAALTPAATPVAAATTTAVPATPAPTPATGPLARYVIRSQPAPLSGSTRAVPGVALVIGGTAPLSQRVIDALRVRGLHAQAIAANDGESLRTAIAATRNEHGAIGAVLALQGLTTKELTGLADWRSAYQRDVLGLFHALQSLGDSLSSATVLSASRLGGTFGRDGGGTGLASAGGGNGLLNCLRYEYPDARLRAVDFGEHDDAEIAAKLVDELFADDRAPEAGYVGATRHVAVTGSLQLGGDQAASLQPSGDWLVLATGGARGITAEILEELARPGMRLVLLGRTATPATEAADTAAIGDAGALKQALLKAALARGEKPRPVEIDREVNRLLVDREIRSNLAKLSATGAIVDYRACDVRDEAALTALIAALYREHGRIDAVIHAAGVIEDKLFADKTAESFERVLGTKLDAAFVLSRVLKPESLKVLALFTSVAGRYGNRGQGDYASANETLNRLAWQLYRQWPQTRVTAINWGPWDAGMASEPIKQQLRARGMEPIPLAEGRRFFVDEITRAPREDVEVVAGVGPWGKDAVPVSAPLAATKARLITEAPRVGAGGAVLLDLQFDPAASSHAADDLARELLSEFATLAWPQWQLAELRDLRHSAVPAQAQAVQLRARAATHSEPGVQSVTVEMLKGKTVLSRATAILLPQNAVDGVTPTRSSRKPRAAIQ